MQNSRNARSCHSCIGNNHQKFLSVGRQKSFTSFEKDNEFRITIFKGHFGNDLRKNYAFDFFNEHSFRFGKSLRFYQVRFLIRSSLNTYLPVCFNKFEVLLKWSLKEQLKDHFKHILKVLLLSLISKICCNNKSYSIIEKNNKLT